MIPIRRLVERRELCWTSPDTSLREAVERMVSTGYSQLPVTDDAGHLRGIVSEQSIVRMQYFTGDECNILETSSVGQCLEDATTLHCDDTLLDALKRLGEAHAVVIVDAEHRPIGILTAYDTSHYLCAAAEGLLDALDIEATLHHYIQVAFPGDALAGAVNAAWPNDKRAKAGELDFHHRIELILADQNWPRFEGAFQSREMFHGLMHRARKIRNKLAHGRGDATPVDLEALRCAAMWLKHCPMLHHPNAPTYTPQAEHGQARPVSQSPNFTVLDRFLSAKASNGRAVRIGFTDFERDVLGHPLPSDAEKHASWWTEDSPHDIAQAWHDAGYRVISVDLINREVTFERDAAPETDFSATDANTEHAMAVAGSRDTSAAKHH